MYCEIFHSCTVKHYDIVHAKDLRENRRGEEPCVLDDNEITLILKRNVQFPQEAVCQLTDDL